MVLFVVNFRYSRVVNDDWALEQAKQNIERYYEVVGLVEMLAETVAVLEKRLPQFFLGASKILTQIGKVQPWKSVPDAELLRGNNFIIAKNRGGRDFGVPPWAPTGSATPL